MLCILAVFIPSFFMQGAAQALFVPLSLAVGFAMVSSYLLSSTFVPVLSTWLLRHQHRRARQRRGDRPFERVARRLRRGRSAGRPAAAGLVVPAYLAAAPLVIVLRRPRARPGDLPQGRRRPVPAPDAGAGRDADRGDREAGHRRRSRRSVRRWAQDDVEISVGYVGLIPSSYPINAIYQWTGGPEEAILRVALKEGRDGRRRGAQGAAPRARSPSRCPACGSRSSRPTSSARS